jgi:ring-1,2-phenylacetyl-CoA epoxidase subunit PaaD
MVSKVDHFEALEARVWDAVASVMDPEIPPLSITQLGIVERVTVTEDAVEVQLLPTFAGCPALDVIAADVEAAVGPVAGDRPVRVRFIYSPPWTSDRITPEGRDALREYGLTPPGPRHDDTVFLSLSSVMGATTSAVCPFCGSRDSILESAFGPTLCRSIHFCRACRNPFEAFKPKVWA